MVQILPSDVASPALAPKEPHQPFHVHQLTATFGYGLGNYDAMTLIIFCHIMLHILHIRSYGDGSKPCTPAEHQNSW